MADQDLLTIFLALTALAILLQTGVLVGFYSVSWKLSHQVEQAMQATRNILGPVQAAAEILQAVSARITRRSA
jgi:hypothetical protein